MPWNLCHFNQWTFPNARRRIVRSFDLKTKLWHAEKTTNVTNATGIFYINVFWETFVACLLSPSNSFQGHTLRILWWFKRNCVSYSRLIPRAQFVRLVEISSFFMIETGQCRLRCHINLATGKKTKKEWTKSTRVKHTISPQLDTDIAHLFLKEANGRRSC